MINWAGLRLQCGLFQNPGSFGIDKIVSAKSRSGGGLRIDQPPQDRIKPWENEIILMEDMHPFTLGALDAGVPAAGDTFVDRAAEYGYPVARDFLHQRDDVHHGRSIIHHLNLHLFWAGVLLENAPQRLLQ